MNFQKVKYSGLGLLLFLSFFFSSCQIGKKELDSLRFEPKVFEKDSCLRSECARIRLVYPYFEGAGESSDFLNVHVEQQMVMFLNIGENQEIVPLDSAVSSFLNSYLEFKNEDISNPVMGYNFDKDGNLRGYTRLRDGVNIDMYYAKEKDKFMKYAGGNTKLTIVHIWLFKLILEKCNFHKE